jgi:hypothetical protein
MKDGNIGGIKQLAEVGHLLQQLERRARNIRITFAKEYFQTFAHHSDFYSPRIGSPYNLSSTGHFDRPSQSDSSYDKHFCVA